jgi:RNA-directed DNA polymerase
MLPLPIANVLARAFVTSDASSDALVQQAALVVRGPRRLVRQLAEHYLATFGVGVRPRLREVVRVLRAMDLWEDDPTLAARVSRRYVRRVPPLEAATMQSPIHELGTRLPSLRTSGALATWLGLTVSELEWFADLRDLNRRATAPTLAHYHVNVRTKPHGGVRVIEAPQPRLKAMQRRILEEILSQVPLYYDAAHGFVKGRSVRTFAQPHVQHAVVLRVDLADFFSRVSGARVQTVFRTLGYPEAVADLLGGLCTTTTPRHLFAATRHPTISSHVLADAAQLHRRPHLPQGAPTSPALANLCAYRLDCRLTGLADWAGAVYTRYADDLAFSGDGEFARHVERYAAQIAAIALEEGWPVQHHKTRIMRQGVRQQLAGVIVNTRVNVARDEYDRLKAILTNCVRHGPASQNREGRPDFGAYLSGKVAWVRSVNEARGSKLQALLARIEWGSEE